MVRDTSGTRTRADELHDTLRARLLDGWFAPGEQVSIRQIAEAEGTSMIPARDALRGLVAEGALEFRGARAIAVPEPDLATLDEVNCARISLEGELAARAAPNLFDSFDRLGELDAGVDAAIQDNDVLSYLAANRAFHFEIYRQARAPLLLSLVELLWLRIGPSMRLVYEGLAGRHPEIDHHRAAILALQKRDAAAFRKEMQADIVQGMSAIRDQATRAFAPKETETQS